MVEWWSNQDAGLIGAIGGGVAGVLGATVGVLAGVVVPRGKCKGFALVLTGGLIVLGAVALGVGIVALVQKQPYHVWYPLVLGGGILALVMGAIFPAIRLRSAQAEKRRLDAQQIRET